MSMSMSMSKPYQIGKSAIENTELVMRASSRDVWFHVNGVPSAHLIYYNPDEHSLDYLRKKGLIYKMAIALKKSSKYHKIKNIEVIYDFVENVTPLTKPGLVICESPKIMTV